MVLNEGSGMDTSFMIGQHLFTGFEGTTIPEDFVRDVKQHRLGNVILFAHNVQSAPQLKALCESLRALFVEATGAEPFIAIDQEGGVVSRLATDATIMPSAMAVAATGDPDNAYQAGLITGRELKAMGVNFNLAPVLDVNSNPDNPVIGVRSYGEDPDTVSRYGLAMMRGLLDGGVLACAKHFPGHGDTAVDSHFGLPVVEKPLASLRELELVPFQNAIRAGIPGVMSSHILFPQVEAQRMPATMSRRIMTGLLREEMGFDGLVLSDCMMMGAIRDHYGTVPGMVAALKAGVDLIFASHSAALAGEAALHMADELRQGLIDRGELTASTERILMYKRQAAQEAARPLEAVGSPEHMAVAARMYEASLTCMQLPGGELPTLGDNPLFVSCLPYLTTPAASAVRVPLSFADYFRDAFGGIAITMPDNPDDSFIEELVSAANGVSCLVVGTYNGHLRTGQLRLVQALARLSVPLICVALRNPYDLDRLPENATGIAAYGYSLPVFRALEKLLRGEIPVRRGRLHG